MDKSLKKNRTLKRAFDSYASDDDLVQKSLKDMTSSSSEESSGDCSIVKKSKPKSLNKVVGKAQSSGQKLSKTVDSKNVSGLTTSRIAEKDSFLARKRFVLGNNERRTVANCRTGFYCRLCHNLASVHISSAKRHVQLVHKILVTDKKDYAKYLEEQELNFSDDGFCGKCEAREKNFEKLQDLVKDLAKLSRKANALLSVPTDKKTFSWYV